MHVPLLFNASSVKRRRGQQHGYGYVLLLQSFLFPLLFLLQVAPSGAFPSYHDPIASEPPLDRPPSQLLCTHVLFTNASFRTYTATAYAPYMPPDPSGCGGGHDDAVIGKVVLDFEGRVGGTQFDRFGALFLGPVELLRFTTPEPSSNRSVTSWKVERDVTDYLHIFLQASTAGLLIPNPVDKTYTGVIYVDVRVSFYAAGGSFRQQQDPHDLPTTIISLTQPTITKPQDPASVMQVTGSSPSLTTTMSLPVDGGGGYTSLYLDLYASPHGSNAPDDYVAGHGDVCGGGTYRELQVWIDGQLAGITYPFPVIYTGGVSPPLWRPLTGIMSFNIPPYRFDLTPFLGLVNDGKPHSYRLTVLGNNIKGFWLLDGILLGYRSPSSVIVGGGGPSGGVVQVEDSGVRVYRNSSWEMGEDILLAVVNAGRTFSTMGALVMVDGRVRTTTVETSMRVVSRNAAQEDTLSITRQKVWMEVVTSVEVDDTLVSRRVDMHEYPLTVYTSLTNATDSIKIEGRVMSGYKRSTTWEEFFPPPPPSPSPSSPSLLSLFRRPSSSSSFRISWSNSVKSRGMFDVIRKTASTTTTDTTNKRPAAILDGSASETFDLAAATTTGDGGGDYNLLHGGSEEEGVCYSRRIEASDGWVRSDVTTSEVGDGGGCPLPYGLSFCGSNWCGSPKLQFPSREGGGEEGWS